MQEKKDFYEISSTENQNLSQKLSEAEFEIDIKNKEILLLKESSVNKYSLSKDSLSNIDISATVYQSRETGKTWIIVHKPFALPREKKFQLWGINHQKLEKAGIFQVGLTGLQYMGELNIMQSFTITIENMGKTTDAKGKPIVITKRIG